MQLLTGINKLNFFRKRKENKIYSFPVFAKVKFVELALRPKFALNMNHLKRAQRYTIAVFKKENRLQTFIAEQKYKSKAVEFPKFHAKT
jgi:hypothetical protein